MAIGTPVAEAFVRIRPQAGADFGRELQREVAPQVRRVEQSLARSNREFSRFGRGALVGTGALGGLGRAAAFASTSFIGGAGLIYALKSTIQAAEQAQVSQTQLTNALEQQGISFEKNRQAIDDRVQSLSKMSGVDDELIQDTFVKFVRRTNDVTESLRLSSIALDVAKGRNISLETATALVTRASLGQAGSLRRLGIEAAKGAKASELLDLLQRKYAGSAEAYGKTAAGAQDRFRVAVENTQEAIGAELLPQLTVLLTRASDWLAESENQERIQRDVAQAVSVTGAAVHGLAGGVETLNKALSPLVGALGGARETLKLVALGFVSLKLARVATGLLAVEGATVGATVAQAELATAATAAGTALTLGAGSSTLARTFANTEKAAVQATAKVGLLSRSLSGLSAITIAPILIPITYEITTRILNATGGDKFFARQGGKVFDALQQIGLFGGVSRDPTPAELAKAIAAITGRPVGTSGPVGGPFVPFTPPGLQGPVTTPSGVPPRGEFGTGIPWLDNALARAEATAGRGDDEGVLRRIQTVLRARLAKAKSLGARTDIQKALNQFGEQLAGLEEQDAQAAQDKLDKAKDRRDAAALRRATRIDTLTQVPAADALRLQIAEATATSEATLLPLLRQQRTDVRGQIATLQELGASKLKVLEATVTLAGIDGWIASINATIAANAKQARDDRIAAAKQALADRVERLTQIPEGLSLQLQIAELNAKTEDELLPLLRQERAKVTTRIAILRDLQEKKKASANDVLTAELNLATINKRIRDIKGDKAAGGFSLTDLFAEAGEEFGLYGSNIGPAGALSRQDARGGLATVVQSKQFAVVQNFFGERNPAQAIHEAARAAVAVR